MAYPDMTPGPPAQPTAPPPLPPPGGMSTGAATPDIRGLIDQSRQMGATDDQIRDLMVKAPFLQDTWQASEKAGIPPNDVFQHFGLSLPSAGVTDTTLPIFPRPEPGAIGRIAQAAEEGYRGSSFWASPEARQAAANLPVVGPYARYAGDVLSGALGTMGAAVRGGQQFLQEAISPISPALGRDVAAMPEAFPTGFDTGPHPPEPPPPPTPVTAAQLVGAVRRAGPISAEDLVGAVMDAGNVDEAISTAAAAAERPVPPEEPAATIVVRPQPEAVGAAVSRETTPAGSPPAGAEEPLLSTEDMKANRRRAELDRILAPPQAGDTNIYVKGSFPTLAEYSGEPKLSQYENLLRERVPDLFFGKQPGAEGRVTLANAARVAEYDTNTVPDPVLRTMQKDRTAQWTADSKDILPTAKPIDLQPAWDWVQGELSDPRIQENDAVKGVLEGFKARLKDASGELKTDPAAAWGMHDNLQNQLAMAKDPLNMTGAEAFAEGQLVQGKNLIDEALNVATDNKFQTALDNYAEASKAINAGRLFNEFRDKLTNMDGNIQAQKFHDFVVGLARERGNPGIDPSMDISDKSMESMMNIDDDLKRARLIKLGGPAGSQTNLLGSLAETAASTAAKKLLGKIPGVGGMLEVGQDYLTARKFAADAARHLAEPEGGYKFPEPPEADGAGLPPQSGGAAATRPFTAEAGSVPGAIFASPNIAEHLDFPAAVAGLQTPRQAAFETVSRSIDQSLGLQTKRYPAVGAWSDGAENSVMTEVQGGTWDQLRAAAAIKGAIGEQKAVLAFQEAPEGQAVLASFPATGNLADIHQNLLADGVEFHTIVPTQGGARVYVAALDGSALDAIDRAAERYGEKPTFQRGRAEFIGTTKEDGTDAEQRADAQAVYSRVVQESGVEGAAALWQRLHNTDGQTANPVGYGAQNRFFTLDDAEAARATLRDKANQFNSGLDPEALGALVRLAGFHMESGARAFADFAGRMLQDVGEAVRPYLQDIYDQASTLLGGTGPRREALTISRQPLGVDPLERNLSVVDILDPAFPSLANRSRGVEEIASQLMERGSNALRNLGIPEGKITGPAPLTDELLARTIATEIKAAQERGGNTSSDWYTHKISEAMAAASTIHPELATDANARMGFTASLAITSQGETVPSNVRLGEQAYAYFKENGRFPTDVVSKQAPAMNANFAKLNDLIDKVGVDETREFLSKDFTVKDLKADGYNITGENVGTNVKGSVILGPKIGGGFYQNLNGNFDPVTMDLWFMRAWGRLTGTLVGMSAESVLKQRMRLETPLAAEGMPVPKTPQGLLATAQQLVSETDRAFDAFRKGGEPPVKTEAHYAAERYLKGMQGINETPANGSQRTWMRSVVMGAKDLLAKEGINVTPADLQAIWWYPEKDLYGKLGGRDSEAVNVDYAQAISDLARSRGVSDADIARAVGSVDQRSGPATEADVARGVQGRRGASGGTSAQVSGPEASQPEAALVRKLTARGLINSAALRPSAP